MANSRLYVLDGRLRPRPIGVPGELYVAGPGVGRGYRYDPAQTAAAFLPDPFATEPGRIYRTGDLARWRPDGSLEYLRRVDNQVKLRGFRIELGEVEAVLRRCAGVRDAAVTVRDESGQQQLVAYVVSHGEAIAPAALRMPLQEQLPRYMVPTHFVVMDALPLLPNGKVNRKALPAPGTAPVEPQCGHVAPGTPEEIALAAIWSEVLKVERPGVHDNFFDAGGDSILAIQIVARAKREGLALSAMDVFEHQTLADMAATARRADVPKGAIGEQASAPLTPIQHWFFEQRLARPSHWNLPALFEVRGPVDRGALSEALRAVVAHHDGLRARFPRRDARAVFAPPENAMPALEWIDLAALPEEQRATAFERRAAELQDGLDIEGGPLVRTAYFDGGADAPGRLLWVVHHLAVDIESWRVLATDLTAAYRAATRGEAPPVFTAPSFAQWANRLADFARSPGVEAEAPEWLARVSGAASLPEDGPRGGNTQSTVRVISGLLEHEETMMLVRDVPRLFRARVSEVLATAMQMAFERWTGRAELLLDLEGHGREAPFDDLDVTRTVGWFTALYPVRLAPEAAAGPVERLRAVKEALRAAPNGGLGYGLLRYLHPGTPGEALRRAPEAQVVLNYRGEADAGTEELLFRRVDGEIGSAVPTDAARRYLLEINASVTRGRLRLDVAYSTARHRRETVQYLVDGVVCALRELLAACREPEAAALSPADFPQARVTGRDLDRLLGRLAGVARR